MAQAGSPKTLRRREMECAVCLDRLRQPKLLCCGHNFCQVCLETLNQNETIACPICRKPTNLGPGGVEELPRNHTMIAMMESFCEQCLYDDRKHRCGHCNKWLCEKCHAFCKPKIELANTRDDFLKQITDQENQIIDNRSTLTEEAQLVISTIEAHGTDMIKAVQRNIKHLKDEVQQQLNKELDVLDKAADNVTDLKNTIFSFCEDRLKTDHIDKKEVDTATIQWKRTLEKHAVKMSHKSTLGIEFVQEKGVSVVGELVRNNQTAQTASAITQTSITTSEAKSADFKEIQFEHLTFGSPGSAPGQFCRPSQVAISPVNNKIFVLDSGNNRILLFNERLEFVSTFGSKGKGQFKFNMYSFGGLSVTDGGLIVVADTNNHRLQVFTEDGQHVRSIGYKGSGPEQFHEPEGLAAHGDVIYVCDSLNHRVQVVNVSGKFIRQFGSRSVFGGKTPLDITLHQSGDIYIAMYSKLFVFSAEGESKGAINTGSLTLRNARGVATDKFGHIIVSDYNTHNIHILTASGRHIRTLGSLGNGAGQLNSPMGVACGQDERIYVADSWNDRIQMFPVKRFV